MRSTKGKIYMNQRQIKATLYDENDIDYLKFSISEDCIISVNLNSAESQKELKDVFSNLLSILTNEDIEIILDYPDDYSRRMYIDVCAEYIKDLNRELQSVSRQMRKELNIQKGTESSKSTFTRKVHYE